MCESTGNSKDGTLGLQVKDGTLGLQILSQIFFIFQGGLIEQVF